jgi:methanethiol S-methyltransferase
MISFSLCVLCALCGEEFSMSPTEIASRLLVTAMLWTVWCVVHSLLNAEGLVRKTGVLDTWFKPYQRLAYTIFAFASLAFALWITPSQGSVTLLKWNGLLYPARIALIAAALALFYSTFRHIGLLDFLGFTALGIGRRSAVSLQALITSGIYGRIRHPQSLAGLLLLWARDLTDTDIVINVVLSLYLLIGARIEDKRLLKEFGEEYARYRERVPAFVPRLPL